MKSRILMIVLMLGFLVPSAAMASSKILLLDDIGASEATFAFVENGKGGVSLTAKVRNKCWDQDCEPYRYQSTGVLKNFSLKNDQVYYNGGGTPVLCGETQGIFQSSKILPACQVTVSSPKVQMYTGDPGRTNVVKPVKNKSDAPVLAPEVVCTVWYGENDCAETTTKYRVYMTIQ